MKYFYLFAAIGLLSIAGNAQAAGEAGVASDVTVESMSFVEIQHNNCSDVEVFTHKAAVHSQSSSFTCGYSDRERAKRLAEDAALSRCYRRGYTVCNVRMSYISKTGYLGYEDGFDEILGYGCLAEAVIRGEY